MSRILLDTTALLAHFLDEPETDQVHRLIEDSESEILICAVSVAEFARRLVGLGDSIEEARSRALDYAGLCDSVVPVDTALATRAFELAADTPVRLPLVDSLIAAAAQLSNATLVHRDPHFREIAVLRQVEIGRK
jgi:predicted nucleic acid-binding protein